MTDDPSCLQCTNAIVSPTAGVYCRIFSEVIPDVFFAIECPALDLR